MQPSKTRSPKQWYRGDFDFGIEINRIILQSITGKSGEDDFAGTLTGADGLKLSCDTSYDDIDGKALQIATSYGDNAFEEAFPWYGKITPIRDRARIGELDNELLARLAAGAIDGIHLAPPVG
ncbi:DUF6119 family protein [Rhizobium mesoamericanum]|uniref:Uncharacterized protein n=1 Tax=Rhizobium mesoamericanum STM3625 TaxID=1211777 RepID=K0PU74_9HYPH|nr:DUF6119 family protein [Rhizobium mesoamericanum]CCM80261.1 hypothetical protein BN77_p230005 [Rhizobium mesoamericanum STM3625]